VTGRPTAVRAPGPRASILIVDDHPANLEAFEAILKPLGQDLVSARSGEEALEWASNREFAVILMDVRIPGMDGFETAVRIRREEKNLHSPIIFITADGMYRDDYALRAYSHGAVDFLVKPFNPAWLESKVRVFVDLYLRGETIRLQEAALRQAEREALERQSETRLLTIIDLMPLCVVAFHADGTPYFCNRAWQEYTGIELNEASVDVLLRAVHQDDRARAREALLGLISNRGQRFELECRLGSARGGYRWHIVRALPEIGENVIVGWIATATDVEEQKQAERRAMAANRMKDEFLAIVSHDLRTPLTAILGWAGMLSAAKADEAKLHRGLETIQRAARAQARLIEDLLDVARIMSGKLHLELRDVSLQEIVRAALEAVRQAAETNGVALEAALEDVPTTLGDPDRLQQVVWNLAMNAVKFTKTGGRIQVCTRSVDGAIEIQVRDNGRGIDPEFLPHVFDRFRQADSTAAQGQGGLGLGLAIVRHIVNLHEGSVSAESAGVGQGATFVVRLPVRSASPIDVPDEAPSSGLVERPVSRSLRGAKILVLDDDADSRDFLAQVLGSAGADVVSASSVRQALDVFEHSPPDVLLSDIGLSGEDGYSFIRAIRALPPDKGGNVAAAALTAYTRPQDAAHALASGFDVHIAKPIEPFEVVGIIADLVQLRR
jgi:PAS domain S-box-containing protein